MGESGVAWTANAAGRARFFFPRMACLAFLVPLPHQVPARTGAFDRRRCDSRCDRGPTCCDSATSLCGGGFMIPVDCLQIRRTIHRDHGNQAVRGASQCTAGARETNGTSGAAQRRLSPASLAAVTTMRVSTSALAPPRRQLLRHGSHRRALAAWLAGALLPAAADPDLRRIRRSGFLDRATGRAAARSGDGAGLPRKITRSCSTSPDSLRSGWSKRWTEA
jgi:hypothetical protein